MEKLREFVRGHKIGLRIIKTGVAVTVCLLVSYALHLQYPFYAVIATVIAMGKSIDISFKAGKNRMIGTFIGALIGMCFAMVQPGNVGLCGLGVIITLYCCHLFKLSSAAPIACIVFFAIMLNLRGAVPWEYAVGRLTDTLVGIVVALAVNLLIMPPNCAGDLKDRYARLCGLVRTSHENAKSGGQIDSKAISAAILRLEETVNIYVAEAKLLRSSDDEVFAISCKLVSFREILHELITVEELSSHPPEKSAPEAVYEYHMDRLESLCGGFQAPL